MRWFVFRFIFASKSMTGCFNYYSRWLRIVEDFIQSLGSLPPRRFFSAWAIPFVGSWDSFRIVSIILWWYSVFLFSQVLEWKEEVKEEVNPDEVDIERLAPCSENLLPLNQAYSSVLQEMTRMLEDYRRNISLPRQMRLADIIAEEEKREQLRATICNEDRALEVHLHYSFIPTSPHPLQV